MKKIYAMLMLLCFCAVALALNVVGGPQKVEAQKNVTSRLTVDGVSYNIIDDAYAEVAKRDGLDNYKGEVTIADNVSDGEKSYPVHGIGRYAFSYCSQMVSVHLPKGLKYIDRYAFQGCTMSEIDIPDGVESIGDEAFAYNQAIQKLQLPSALVSLGKNVASACTKLTEIGISETNASFKIVDNALLTKDGTKMLFYPCGRDAEAYSIPDGVVELVDDLFRYSKINVLNIPASTTVIPTFTFYGMPTLERINVAEGNGSYHATDGVLFDNEGVMLKYPEAKTDAFYALPDGTKRIADEAFSNTQYLRKLEMPQSLDSIEGTVCWRSSVDTIVVRSTTPAATSDKSFTNIGKTTLVVPDGCIAVYQDADGWCNFSYIVDSSTMNMFTFTSGNLVYQKLSNDETDLTVRVMGFAEEPTVSKNLTISKSVKYNDISYSVTEIAPYAFAQSGSLKSVSIGNSIVKIGKGAFEGSSISGLTFITNSKLEVIGEEAFSYCQLSSITLPASLKTIEYGAFMYSGDFSGAKALTIPQNVEYIDEFAFLYCNFVNAFNVASQNEHYVSIEGVLYNKDVTELIAYPQEKHDDTFWLPATVDTIRSLCNDYVNRLVVQREVPPVCLFLSTWNATLYVPAGTKATYEDNEDWDNFEAYVEMDNSKPHVEDGDYIFYNRETDTFLSRGSDWGTRATLQRVSVPIMIVSDKLPGDYYLRFFDAATANEFLGIDGEGNPFTDLSDSNPVLWDVQMVGDGRVVLYNNAYKVWLKGQGLHEGCTLTDDINEATPFELLSPEEYAAIINARHNVASEITPAMTPVDKTDLLKNPEMSTNLKYWNTQFSGQHGPTMTTRVGLTETYHCFGHLYQTLTGLEPGIYKFSLEGYYRGGSNGMCAFYSDNNLELQSAFIFANNDEQPFATWASGRSDDEHPNTMEEAYALISEGKYKTDVYTRVGEDGTLTVGLAEPEFRYGGWMIWRNATLTYYEESADGIDAPTTSDESVSIFSASGLKQNTLQKGLNIVKGKDGRITKVIGK